MSMNEGGAWSDPGATATDNVDGDLTSAIVKTGAVDPATPGLYTLTYSATDAAGNAGSASRVVTVVALMGGTSSAPPPTDTTPTPAPDTTTTAPAPPDTTPTP